MKRVDWEKVARKLASDLASETACTEKEQADFTAQYIAETAAEFTVLTKPGGFALERAAELLGPSVLVRMNQSQLANAIDNALEPIVTTLTAELRKIDADERYHYEAAQVVINAPLALEQLAMKVRANQVQRVLELIGYQGPELAIEPGPRNGA